MGGSEGGGAYGSCMNTAVHVLPVEPLLRDRHP